jgi:hypothetical protein
LRQFEISYPAEIVHPERRGVNAIPAVVPMVARQRGQLGFEPESLRAQLCAVECQSLRAFEEGGVERENLSIFQALTISACPAYSLPITPLAMHRVRVLASEMRPSVGHYSK